MLDWGEMFKVKEGLLGEQDRRYTHCPLQGGGVGAKTPSHLYLHSLLPSFLMISFVEGEGQVW